MPVNWTIDPSRRRIEVVLAGNATADDVTRFLDAVEAADAVPYSKLIDATAALGQIDNRAMAVVGQRVATYRNPGPIAVVLPARGLDGHAKLFLLAVDADSRTRLFKTAVEASAWLDAVEHARSSPGETTQ